MTIEEATRAANHALEVLAAELTRAIDRMVAARRRQLASEARRAAGALRDRAFDAWLEDAGGDPDAEREVGDTIEVFTPGIRRLHRRLLTSPWLCETCGRTGWKHDWTQHEPTEAGMRIDGEWGA